MSEKVDWAVETGLAPGCDSLTEMQSVPIDHDGGEEIEAGHAVMLSLGGAISDFALPADAQGVLEGVMGLALVQADLGATLHVGIEQPVNDEERTFDPPDLAQGDGQLMLTWISGEFAQKLAGRHDSGDHGGGAAQDVRPVWR